MVTVHVRHQLTYDLMPTNAGLVQLVGRLATTVDQPLATLTQSEHRAGRPVASTKGAACPQELQRDVRVHDVGVSTGSWNVGAPSLTPTT